MIDAEGLADALTDLVSTIPAAVAPVITELVNELRDGAQVVRPGDQLGTKDVAELLGVDRTTASRWHRDGYLPEPFQRAASGPLWLRPALETFAEKHAASADAAGRRPVGTAHR
jgi:hypothetical protein